MWGYLVSSLLMVPLAFMVLLAAGLSGGGCEGRPSPCTSNYTPFWIMLSGVVAVAIGLGFVVNFLIENVRRWRDRRSTAKIVDMF
jgi:phosphate/sulfate permease